LKTQNKFWWFVLVAITVTLGVLLTIAYLFWQQLSGLQQHDLIVIFKENFAYFFMVGVLLFTGFGFTLDWFFRFYIIPVNQLADETQIITTVNSDHRIKVQGSYDVVRLADIINQSADKFATIQADVKRQLQKAKTATETEKDILAALLEGLPQGIIVCNADGKIVFYNRKVKSFFTRHHRETPKWMGLDRSIYGMVDKALVQRAIERIGQKLAESKHHVCERFLMGANGEIALPAELVPVLDCQHHITGFIIYIEDSVEKFQKEQELFSNLQSWKHQLIQSVSVIKTAAEVIKDESYESEKDRDQLVQILCKESAMAAQTLSKREIINQWYPDRPWPLTPVDAAEWCRYLVHRSGEAVEVDLTVDAQDVHVQISIDMHHLTNAILFVIGRIAAKGGTRKIDGRFYQKGAWLYLDLSWRGGFNTVECLKQWKECIPVVKDLCLEISLADILRLHGAKLWTYQHYLPEYHCGYRFLIPALERAEMIRSNGHITILPDSRPEYYDFDLFQQAGQTPEMDNRLLTELTYTVFDTETTGLDPQGGDEIISIGALRIVNGRILRKERFEQLINPLRRLPWASVKYHGIRSEMLVDQPTIDQVLPAFHQFCQGTVLVGHNVAFDMRMLQLKEASTGIKFINPVIDTMLLSAVIHPAHHDHSLSAVADRLGVQIIGRHTAIGDAIATGEVFLKLISLLANHNIATLLEARQTSEKTYYARLKY
jgi:DNA polymerase-3 subunit epsilon